MLEQFAKRYGYDDPLEIYLSRIQALLTGEYEISRRALTLFFLPENKEIEGFVSGM